MNYASIGINSCSISNPMSNIVSNSNTRNSLAVKSTDEKLLKVQDNRLHFDDVSISDNISDIRNENRAESLQRKSRYYIN